MFYITIMDKTNKIKINLTNATHWFENYVNFLFYCKMILDGIVLEEEDEEVQLTTRRSHD